MSEYEAAAYLIITLMIDDDDKRTRGSTRNSIRRREEERMCANLGQELLFKDTRTYREMMRMSYESFKKVLGFIEPHITSNDSAVIGAQLIRPAETLVLAIRFLAAGETNRSLSLQFRVSERAISYISDEVTKAIVQYIGKDYIKIPSTSEDWLKISETFQSRWNFPNCLGAVDGKHIQIRLPPGTGSEYFNYKKTFSIILLAIAGPDYESICADIGRNGRMNVTGVWNSSDLSKKIEGNCLNIPAPTPLPLGYIRMPYVFVGDGAFTLKSSMMKPYPQTNLTPEKRVYNYNHSRVRRISENLFGIVANKWRNFQQPLNLSPEKAPTITTCALVLHNFIRKSLSKNDDTPLGFVDSVSSQGELVQGSWRSEKRNSLGVFSSSVVSQVGRKALKTLTLFGKSSLSIS